MADRKSPHFFLCCFLLERILQRFSEFRLAELSSFGGTWRNFESSLYLPSEPRFPRQLGESEEFSVPYSFRRKSRFDFNFSSDE